jgi:hypothetical protein
MQHKALQFEALEARSMQIVDRFAATTHQWSSLPIQAQARGKSLPELQKACGLMGPLVIIEERRALGVEIKR